MYFEYLDTIKKKAASKKLIHVVSFFVMLLLLVAISLYVAIFGARTVEVPTVVTITKGMTLAETASLLEDEKIVRSHLSLRVLGKASDISVKAGDYLFTGKQRPAEILERLDLADYGDVYVSVTIPEGSTIKEISRILEGSLLDNYDNDIFLEQAQDLEGYLFPDTYALLPSINTEDIISLMQKTFESKKELLKADIDQSSRTFEDIVIMASIIEKEATNNQEEQKIISGILWKRLDEGKFLQIDAPFLYINGEVRSADLRKDGPYNTYTRLGLTPTAIGNPGISALEAALNPTDSAYYFYLHGKDGKVHYGKTYNQHVNNINQYLR